MPCNPRHAARLETDQRSASLQARQAACDKGVLCWTADNAKSQCGCSCGGRYHGEWGDIHEAAQRLDRVSSVPNVPSTTEGLERLQAFRRDVEIVLYGTPAEAAEADLNHMRGLEISAVTPTMRAVHPRCERLLADTDQAIARVEADMAEAGDLADLPDDELDEHLGVTDLTDAERELARDEFRDHADDNRAASQPARRAPSSDSRRRREPSVAVAAGTRTQRRRARRGDTRARRDQRRQEVRGRREQRRRQRAVAGLTPLTATPATPTTTSTGPTRSTASTASTGSTGSRGDTPAAAPTPRPASSPSRPATQPTTTGGSADGDLDATRAQLRRLSANRKADHDQRRTGTRPAARTTTAAPPTDKVAASRRGDTQARPRRAPSATWSTTTADHATPTAAAAPASASKKPRTRRAVRRRRDRTITRARARRDPAEARPRRRRDAAAEAVHTAAARVDPGDTGYDSVDQLVTLLAGAAGRWLWNELRAAAAAVELAVYVAVDWLTDTSRRRRVSDAGEVVDVVEPAAIEATTSTSYATRLFHQQIGLVGDLAPVDRDRA